MTKKKLLEVFGGVWKRL